MSRPPLGPLLWSLALVAAGCTGPATQTTTPTSTAPPTAATTPAPTVAPTPPATPTGRPPTPPPTAQPSPSPTPEPQIGLPSASCINGWLSPPPGSAEYDTGVELLSLAMGLDSPFEVVDMRYFIGPDPPWIIEPFYTDVERWYIKARLVDDPSFAGRWLLEARTEDVRGISAVAPFDSTGYSSPDWVGFVGEGPPRPYPGLPGQWGGIAYDFVTGEGDTGQPGLPDEVVGCLEGT